MLILFLNAIEIPFIVRFGYRKGVNLKAVIFVLVIAAVGIYFLFGDISMFGSWEDFMQFIIDILNGRRGGTILPLKCGVESGNIISYHLLLRLLYDCYSCDCTANFQW